MRAVHGLARCRQGGAQSSTQDDKEPQRSCRLELDPCGYITVDTQSLWTTEGGGYSTYIQYSSGGVVAGVNSHRGCFAVTFSSASSLDKVSLALDESSELVSDAVDGELVDPLLESRRFRARAW